MPTILKEPIHNAEFLISEAQHTLSREEISLATDHDYPSGLVLAQLNESNDYIPLNPDGADGSQTAKAILLMKKSKQDQLQMSVCIARLAEVHKDLLIWPSGISQEQQEVVLNALSSVFICAR